MNLSIDPREAVGATFANDEFERARALSWKALNETAAQVRVGMTEAEGKNLLQENLKKHGVEKLWHPSQVRFGSNTCRPYGVPSEPGVALKENDIFFIDIGPVFFGHEGDVGATYVLGEDPELKRLATDAKNVFNKVRDRWLETREQGIELYNFAKSYADTLGWELSLEGASGHRIAEFLHSVHYRGDLKDFDKTPSPQRWILEIHLHDRKRGVGAFYEDVL